MKTILVLTNSLGGLFSFRKEVMVALLKKDYHVVVASPHDSEEREKYFFDIGCECEFNEIDCRGTNPLHDIKLIIYYQKLIRKYKPLAILTYTIKPNIYGGVAARWLKVPQLANITGLGSAVENPGLLQKFTIFMYRLGLKKARKVFYQNTSIEEFCQLHRIGKTGCLLPGSGVNLSWHSFQNYPLENSKMEFLFIGRVMRDKGVEEFFKMAKTIRQKYPQTEFHILGKCDEHYEGQLQSLEKEGVVIWHGPVPDVRPYIKEAWCTIHPSYHEGMANVLLETCSAGRPIITSNIHGCQEAVDDGINGYLFKVKDTKDLISKVEQFVLLPYEQKVRMGLASRKKVELEFDRQIVVNSYLNEIESINYNV